MATRLRAKSMAEGTRGGNIDFPTGYVQNPYASEMTPEQRLVTEQEGLAEQELPMPNYTHSRGTSTASATLADGFENLRKRARRSTEGFIDDIHEWLWDRSASDF